MQGSARLPSQGPWGTAAAAFDAGSKPPASAGIKGASLLGPGAGACGDERLRQVPALPSLRGVPALPWAVAPLTLPVPLPGLHPQGQGKGVGQGLGGEQPEGEPLVGDSAAKHQELMMNGLGPAQV